MAPAAAAAKPAAKQAPQTLVVGPGGATARVEPLPLDGEVHGVVDELLVFVVEEVKQVTHTRHQDIQNVISPLLQEQSLRRGGTREHIIDYRYLIRKGPNNTTSASVYKEVPPMRVELYKGRQRVLMRVPPGQILPKKQLKTIVDFFKPKLTGYDPAQSVLQYPRKHTPHFEADAMDDEFEGDYGADGALVDIRGIGKFGPDGMPLRDGEHTMRYGADGFLEPIIDTRPRHGFHVQRAWYRAESGRLEIEDVAVRRFHLICNVVDLLKKTGRIQSGRWTNDPEVFPDDLLRGEILPFPPDDRQRYVPQEFCDEAGETLVYISGAAGNNYNVINGEYILVGSFNGKSLYKKLDRSWSHHEDHADKWLRYVAARKCWMVSHTKDLHVNNSAGWCCSLDSGLHEPSEALQGWRVMVNGKWQEQELRVNRFVSTEARTKRRLPERTTEFEKRKPTWHRLTDYATFPSSECRLLPIAQGRLVFGSHNIDGVHMGRVLQGGLQNAYFVEALNAISLRPALVRRLFFAYDCAKSVYSVRLFKNGVWLCVEVDDFVPKSDDKANPLCCRHEQFPYVLWPSIVEKAYAKACTVRHKDAADFDSGGWEAVGGGGRVEEALVDLTGGVGGAFSTRDVSPDRLFVYLHEMQRLCLWVCRVNLHRAVTNGVNFNPYANYAVNRAVHFQGESFVQLRCVSERMANADVGLEAALPWDVHPELLKRYPGKSSEGFMWLTIHDFHQYFDDIFECRLVNSPDAGIVGMPSPKLPIAKMFPDADWLRWAKEHIREQEDPRMMFFEDVDLSHLLDEQKRVSPSQQLLPGAGGPMMTMPGTMPGTGMPGMVPGTVMPSTFPSMMQDIMQKPTPGETKPVGAMAAGQGHAWEALTERSPVFYEHVFATESSITEHKPPQLDVCLPAVPCEIAVACEQVDNRLSQVGKYRKKYTALLLKVYETAAVTEMDHGRTKVYSNQLVCKSEWTYTRGAMVAWRCKAGGDFKVMCSVKSGTATQKLIFRVYSSVPYVDAHASQSLKREQLVEDKEPPRGIRCTLVGSVVPERLFRVDQPEPVAEDLDALRQRHMQDRQALCPAM